MAKNYSMATNLQRNVLETNKKLKILPFYKSTKKCTLLSIIIYEGNLVFESLTKKFSKATNLHRNVPET